MPPNSLPRQVAAAYRGRKKRAARATAPAAMTTAITTPAQARPDCHHGISYTGLFCRSFGRLAGYVRLLVSCQEAMQVHHVVRVRRAVADDELAVADDVRSRREGETELADEPVRPRMWRAAEGGGGALGRGGGRERRGTDSHSPPAPPLPPPQRGGG